MVLSLGQQFIFDALGLQLLAERLYIQIFFPLLHKFQEFFVKTPGRAVICPYLVLVYMI